MLADDRDKLTFGKSSLDAMTDQAAFIRRAEIVGNMDEIADIAEHNGRVVVEAAGVAAHLKRQAGESEGSTAGFRVQPAAGAMSGRTRTSPS